MKRAAVPRAFVSCVLLGLLLACLAGSAPGQEAGRRQPAGDTARQEQAAGRVVRARTFTIRYRNPGDVAQVIQPALSPGGSYTLQPGLRTLTVMDTEEALLRVADLVRSFDVPPRNVEVTINLLMGTREPAAQHQTLSREIRGITDVLPDITKWTSYKLLDSASITGSEGAVTSRTMGGEEGPDVYGIELGIQSVDEDHGVIRIEPFTVRKEIRVENHPPVWRQVYSTKLNLKPNRLLTVVAARSEKSEKALFLTIRARVVE